MTGIAPTHRKIHWEGVVVMRVENGKITDPLGRRQSTIRHASN